MMDSMKNNVREMLNLQPHGEAGIDRRRGLRNPGVTFYECRHAGKLAKALGDGDQNHQDRGT